jgi:hypothetical protein
MAAAAWRAASSNPSQYVWPKDRMPSQILSFIETTSKYLDMQNGLEIKYLLGNAWQTLQQPQTQSGEIPCNQKVS